MQKQGLLRCLEKVVSSPFDCCMTNAERKFPAKDLSGIAIQNFVKSLFRHLQLEQTAGMAVQDCIDLSAHIKNSASGKHVPARSAN